MPNNERAPIPFRPEPAHPTTLPEELVGFLQDRPFACLLQGTDQGTVVIIKAPDADIQNCRGRVPILLRHELHDHPRSPVIRTTLRLYDDPERPLAFEMYTNIAEDDQREDFAVLVNQSVLTLLFYDERVHHRLTKQVGYQPEVVPQLLEKAQELLSRIPQEQRDFEKAKQGVMTQTRL